MKTKQLLLMLFAGALLASCGQNAASESTETVQAEKIEKVKTVSLGIQEVSREIENSATLQAWEELHYSPAAPGRIEHIYVEVGSRVKKGQLLVEMDQTQMKQAEIQLKTLETDYKRLDTLRKMGTIAQQQFDQVKAQYDVAKTNVNFLAQNARLYAPFSGIISGKYFEPGEMYSGSPVMSIGKSAVVSLIQVDKLKMLVSVSERYFPMIKKESPITVSTDVYPGKTYKGHIHQIYPVIDAISRTFKVEIQVDNADAELIPGMFARVKIEFDKDNARMIPAIALMKMTGTNQRYVFVIRDGKAKQVFVEPGKRYDELIEVISTELKDDDQIIYMGQARLVDGVKVEAVN